MFWLAQAQEDLHLARSADQSADVLRLQEEISQAESKIKQMSSERDTLLERLKVSPGAPTSMMHVNLLHRYQEDQNYISHQLVCKKKSCRLPRRQLSQTDRRRRAGRLTWKIPLKG